MPLFSTQNPTSDQAVDTLRLTNREWRELIDEIDRESSRYIDKLQLRRDERVAYRNVAHLLATITAADGRIQRFRVRTHDLSASGLGFLHGTFIYPGSKVKLVLNHCVQGPVYIDGVVRRCEHCKRHIHRVGVEFNKPIEAEMFILAEAPPTPDVERSP